MITSGPVPAPIAACHRSSATAERDFAAALGTRVTAAAHRAACHRSRLREYWRHPRGAGPTGRLVRGTSSGFPKWKGRSTSTAPVEGSGSGRSDEEPAFGLADLADLTDDQLLARIRRIEEARREGREQAGRMLAELQRRGRLSWPVIARETGLGQTTAYRLAQRYRTTDGGIERPSGATGPKPENQ